MFKSLIAGATALSLTLATSAPVQASGLDRDDVGKVLLGIAAVAIIGSALDNKNERSSGAAPMARNNILPMQRNIDRNPLSRRAALPQSCLTGVRTSSGVQRLYGQRCLQRNYARVNSLPQRCAVRLYTTNGPARGFDPLCLRNAGYVTDRRH